YSVAVSRHLDSLRSRMAEAERYVLQKQSQLDEVIENRNRAAADLRLGQWVDRLPELRDSIGQYRVALNSLWPLLESSQEARTVSDWVWGYLEQAPARETRQKEIAGGLERRAVAAEVARAAAFEARDAVSSEILERVARARERLEALRIEEKEMRQRYHDT